MKEFLKAYLIRFACAVVDGIGVGIGAFILFGILAQFI